METKKITRKIQDSILKITNKYCEYLTKEQFDNMIEELESIGVKVNTTSKPLMETDSGIRRYNYKYTYDDLDVTNSVLDIITVDAIGADTKRYHIDVTYSR